MQPWSNRSSYDNPDRDEPVEQFLHRDKHGDWSKDHSAVATALSHRAARRVEELQLVVNGRRSDTYLWEGREISYIRVGVYALAMDSLPCETLHVLDLTNCDGLELPVDAAALVLPRLWSLRLRHCTQHLQSLQSLIDAAPALAVVRLQFVIIEEDSQSDYESWDRGYGGLQTPKEEDVPLRLRCPAATVLVLDSCRWKEGRRRGNKDDTDAPHVAVDINAPKLRRFRYKGLLRPFSFCPQPPELEQVDLHFFQDSDRRRYTDPCGALGTFWRFARNFTSTKEMKLRLNHVEDIAVLGEVRRVELLPVLHRLQRLELQGVHMPKGKTAAVAIANLLRCCPLLSDLRMNLTAAPHEASRNYKYAHEFLERKFRSDRDKCIDHLTNSEMVAVSPGGDRVNFDQVSEIPGLSLHSFECLRSSLRTVGLRFRVENSDCLGVKLIKFFAENAMVLQEMHIDSGNGKFREHMNRKVETWMANSSKRRESRAPSIVVLPLERCI